MLQSVVSERVGYSLVTGKLQLRESFEMTLWIWDATFHAWGIWCLYGKKKGDRHWGALLLRGLVFLFPFCRCRNWGQGACNTLSPSDEWQGHLNWFLLDSKPKTLSTVLWLSIHWEFPSGIERRHLDNRPRFSLHKRMWAIYSLDTPSWIPLGHPSYEGNSIYQDKGRHASISLNLPPIPWSSHLLTVKMRDLKLRSGNSTFNPHKPEQLPFPRVPFYWAPEPFLGGGTSDFILFSGVLYPEYPC